MNSKQLKEQIDHDILSGEFWILFADDSGMRPLRDFACEFFDGKPGPDFEILVLDKSFGNDCSEISPPVAAIGFASKRRMSDELFRQWCEERGTGVLYRSLKLGRPMPFGTVLADDKATLCERVYDWFEQPNSKPPVTLN